MTAIGIAVTVPLALIVALWRNQLLALFGPAYVSAGTLLVILLIGVAANAISGPIGLIVSVTGQEAIGRRTLLTACALFFVGLPIATLTLGAPGAAALWVTITVGWNIALWLQADLSASPQRISDENANAPLPDPLA